MGVENKHMVITNIKLRKCHSCGTHFLFCDTIKIWGQITLCCGAVLSILGCLSDILGLYPLDASNSSPVIAPETVSRHYRVSLGGGQNHCQLRTAAAENMSLQRDHKVKVSDITMSPMRRKIP